MATRLLGIVDMAWPLEFVVRGTALENISYSYSNDRCNLCGIGDVVIIQATLQMITRTVSLSSVHLHTQSKSGSSETYGSQPMEFVSCARNHTAEPLLGGS